jgi:hypothetical protein
MPNTYTKIASVAVGSGGSTTISFTSIPSTYTDLKLVSSLRGDANTVDMTYTLNGLTTNQSMRLLRGNGTASASGTDTLLYGLQNASTYTSSTFTNSELYIPNYTSSNYKSISQDGVTENNATISYTYLVAQLWSATAAINAIGLVAGSSGKFVEYSTATLYGISKT